MHGTSARLPLELEDLVIDQLFNETDALKTCSLVSQAWRVSAQRWLFYSTYISRGTDWTAFSSFLQLSPHVGSSIEGLDLTGPLPVSSFDALLQILDSLPQLRSLAFTGMLLKSRTLPDTPAAKFFPQVQNLTLSPARATVTFSTITRVLPLFPGLQTCRIIQYTCRHTEPLSTDRYSMPRLNLAELSVCYPTARLLAFFTASVESCSALSIDADVPTAGAVGDLVKRLAASITTLEISRSGHRGKLGNLWQSLNLHLCVNLHSVVVYAGPTFEDEEPTLAEQRIALQCLPSSIRSCTVGFHEKDIRNLDFGELRPLLTRFGRLERLVFQYHLGFKVDGGEPVEVEQARERIAASFPDLERRGVFHLREAQRGHYSQRTSIQGRAGRFAKRS